MGVELRLLPVIQKNVWLSHEMWTVVGEYEFWKAIDSIPQQPITEPIGCFLAQDKKTGETTYGNVETDPYGSRLKYTTVSDLLTLKDHKVAQDNWRNRAVWAALQQMPPEWIIVLYWH